MQQFPPVSYNIPFDLLDSGARLSLFRELALNGAKHIVLGTELLPRFMSNPELPETVASEMASAGISFMDSHAPYGKHWDMGAPFEEERPARILRLKLAIELAAFFKVSSMTLHLGKKDPAVTPEQRFHAVCKALDELLPLAEERNVTLCLENGFACLGFPKIILAIKERFPADSLGFCFDAGHANITSPHDPALKKENTCCKEILEAMLPHIVNCHIHDNDGTCDKHDLPGRGNADWSYICAMLKKAPRLQVLQSEVHIDRNGVPVRELVETFEGLFGKDPASKLN